MIEVEETAGGLRAVDAAKNEVEIGLSDWVPGQPTLDIGRDVDRSIAGCASGVRLPGSMVTIESERRPQVYSTTIDEPQRIAPDDHLIKSNDAITVFVRVDDGFDVCPDARADVVTLSFRQVTPVTIGFRSIVRWPSETLRIPPTPEGVAAALSASGSAHKSSGPERSYPSMRGHPPAIEVDVRADPSDIDVSDDRPTVRVWLPRTLESLFVASPLVFYLGAIVEVDPRVDPRIETPDGVHELAANEDLADQVAALLSRVFYLDCLVRNVGPHRFDVHELGYLDELPLDPDRVYPLSMGARLAEYLSVPFERIEEHMPRWPLSVSLEPIERHVPTLPHLLDRLALLSPAESVRIDERSVVERSLGDFIRSTSDGDSRPKADTPEVVEPAYRHGALHGWMGDGTPVDAFKCPPSCFSNREKYLDDTSPRRVVVVLNDDEMRPEFDEVVRAYRERAEHFSIDVEVLDGLCADELASVFRTRSDLVHYIGHCDPGGLRCIDGNLSATDLEGSNARTFFLNACGSYTEGLALVQRGSVAGAVTIGDVLDDQARTVGATFARMLGMGYSIERSLRLARRRTITNHQYAVVGDGTHVVAQGNTNTPATIVVTDADDRGFFLRSDLRSPRLHGAVLFDYPVPRPMLAGSTTSHLVTDEELERKLRLTDQPTIYEGRFYWSEELLDELF